MSGLASSSSHRAMLLAGLIVWSGSSVVGAQTLERRVEIAPGISMIQFKDFDSYLESVRRESPSTIRLHSWFDPGPSFRLTINMSRTLAFEGTTTLLPRFGSTNGFPSKGGAKGLIDGGVALSHSVGHIDVLAVGRGGAVSFTQAPQIAAGATGSPGLIVQVGANRTYASAYAAAGVRVPLFPRSSLRAEVGDFVIWYRPQPSAANPSFSRHNLRIDIGIAFSFGPALH
jgi:hypothetical protein